MNTTQEALALVDSEPVSAAAATPRPAVPFRPLRLNLLHEQHAAAAQAKRDPLKLGLYALGGVAALLAGYYGLRVATVSSLQGQLAGRQAEFAAKYEKPLKTADAREKELTALVAAGTALKGRTEGRFYWAPLLEIIGRTVPRDVQLTGLNGALEGKDKDAARVPSLTLEGLSAGTEPRDVAERFRVSLAEALGKSFPGASASFRSLDDGEGTVSLDGKTLRTARFTITVSLRRAASAASTPAR